jgi:hypothetical protein
VKQLTPNLIEQARALRADGIGWRHVAHRLGVSEYVLRCAIEPDYRQYKLDLNVRQRNAAKQPRIQRPRPVDRPPPRYVRHAPKAPPADVLAQRDLALELRLKPRSVTAQLLGDPLPGRSALDQRQRK